MSTRRPHGGARGKEVSVRRVDRLQRVRLVLVSVLVGSTRVSRVFNTVTNTNMFP